MYFLKVTVTFKSSHPEVFLEKGVLKICSKFTGEHQCRSTISIKLLFRTPFLKNTSGWLLLDFSFSDFSDFSLEDYLPTCEGLASRLMILICLLTLVMFPASTVTNVTRKPRCNFDTFNNFC